MSDYILFLNSQNDKDVAIQVYGQKIQHVKVRVHEAEKISGFDKKVKVWIDCAFDGYPVDNDKSTWHKYMGKLKHHENFLDSTFTQAPKKEILKKHLYEVLDKCLEHKPDTISIPQFIYSFGTSNNKINRELAKTFAEWRIEKGFKGDAILPVILDNKDSTLVGSERTKKIEQIIKNYHHAGADGIWIVDSTLQDQAGTGNFDKKRFPALIELHQKVQDSLKPKMHIAGPYWGINILLWARGIITNPAFALGTGFQHYGPSGFVNTPTPRMAIPPLRRWAKATSDFKRWLETSTTKMNGEEISVFKSLIVEFDKLKATEKHKVQVATFYLEWFEKFYALPPGGRALALYQDLSGAYVLSTNLTDITSEDGTSKKPGIIAKQLMLNCL